MIDYLEQVLEGEEDETLWQEKRRVAVAPPGKESAQEAPAVMRSAVRADGPEESGPVPAAEGPEEEFGLMPETEWTGDPEDRGDPWEDWLPRTDGTGETAGALLGDLRRARRGSRAARSGQRVMTVTWPVTENAPAGLDAEALDLAVQRDARRYDGGFALY